MWPQQKASNRSLKIWDEPSGIIMNRCLVMARQFWLHGEQSGNEGTHVHSDEYTLPSPTSVNCKHYGFNMDAQMYINNES